MDCIDLVQSITVYGLAPGEKYSLEMYYLLGNYVIHIMCFGGYIEGGESLYHFDCPKKYSEAVDLFRTLMKSVMKRQNVIEKYNEFMNK